MIETMINWGVKYVFGMAGHSNLGIAEAIRKQCENKKLKFIGVRHEGAAAFAASVYGKLKGTPAACLAIAGPGGTNLLTGLWDAKMDRVPVLALTGQVDIQFLGPGSFQELDLTAAFQSVTCFSQSVLSESNHSELMSLALKHAILNRDVSHLTFPNQIQDLMKPYVEYYNNERCHLSVNRDSPTGREIQNKLFGSAKIISLPRIGGLHHIYKWDKAA
ncbi:MAG: hypothetical protein GY699_07185 [Desulfobacteraceae bacterium]|nr:hypothetical protein [Desulfobacteraceae bacterium]